MYMSFRSRQPNKSGNAALYAGGGDYSVSNTVIDLGYGSYRCVLRPGQVLPKGYDWDKKGVRGSYGTIIHTGRKQDFS